MCFATVSVNLAGAKREKVAHDKLAKKIGAALLQCRIVCGI
jgi:hypothetical protein